MRMVRAVGPTENCIKDLERMSGASVKSHDTKFMEDTVAPDDVSGVRLTPELVKEARWADVENFQKMEVYTMVSNRRC